jgi:hypothetical protein
MDNEGFDRDTLDVPAEHVKLLLTRPGRVVLSERDE